MNWLMATVEEEQVHRLWLVVKDKGYHRERLDRVADMVAADPCNVVVAVKLGFVRPKVI
jgi:hypothetical protein